MTANAFAEDVVKAKKAGMNDHIAKPLDRKKMRAVLAASMTVICVYLKRRRKNQKQYGENTMMERSVMVFYCPRGRGIWN